jgi:hypothetical protein
VLQHSDKGTSNIEILEAARQIVGYHTMTTDQKSRYNRLTEAAAYFIATLVDVTEPGPERSTAISRAREAKVWAAGAIALEGL